MRNIWTVLRLLLVCFLSTAAVAVGQVNPVIHAVVDGIEYGKPDSAAPKLIVSQMRLDIKIHGRMAEVVIETTITNPSDEEVEARYSLSMPTDAVVTGYALDIKGKLIDGVLLDQPKAKAVYEDEIRKDIDPGLAEVTRGNVFQTRIYRIDSEESRTIRVRYVAPVDLASGLIMPLQSEGPIGNLIITLSADGLKAPPSIALPQGGVAQWVKQGAVWRATSEAKDRALDGPLTLSGGAVTGEMLVSRHTNGRDYFQIADFDRTRDSQTLTPGRIRIYWDSSLSRRDDLLTSEIALLKSLFAKVPDAKLELVRFHAAEPRVEGFSTGESALAALANTTYRGGTSFKNLDNAGSGRADLCLLFSDGAPTLDTDAEFRPGCRLAVITSAKDANRTRLGRMARAAKGQLLQLTETNGADLVERLLKPAITVVDAQDSNGNRLSFRNLTAPDGRWFVVGQMPNSGTDVVLTVAGLRKGLKEQIYSPAETGKNNAAGALWAADAIEALAENPLMRDTMHKMAQSHQVASPTMAFMVLDRPDQYLRANIEPPVGYDEEWMEEYRELAAERKKEQDDARKEKLELAVESWAERKTWWNKRLDPPKRVKPKPVSDGRTPPPSAPPPPLSVPAKAEGVQGGGFVGSGAAGSEESGYDDIIVTSQRVSENLQSVPLSISGIGSAQTETKVEIADVLSKRPYLKELDAAPVEKRPLVLTEQEKIYGMLPGFYLDASEWFRLKGEVDLAAALLLSALELPATNDETRHIVAFRLERTGRVDAAIAMLELLAASSDFRPQPKRSLALALIARARKGGAGALIDLERAFKLLKDVALEPSDVDQGSDFEGIETVALMEANAITPRIDALGGNWTLDKRLVGKLDTDVRIVIEWTNDDADIDLWVIEPGGERVYYGNEDSEGGGLISNDMTDGYGPEEYVVRRAKPGKYRIKIDGYSGDRLNPNGNGQIMVRMIRDFARPNEQQDLVDAEISFDDEVDDGEDNQPARTDGDAADDYGGKLIATMTVAKKVRNSK